MKKVIEKTRPAYVLGIYYESPKLMCVYNESIMVKMEFELTMYVCGDRFLAYRAFSHLHLISKYWIKQIKNCSGCSYKPD